MVSAMSNIVIIQGDTYEAELEIIGLTDLSVIEKCVFTCSYLQLCKELQANENGKNELKLSHEETEKLKACVSDFDITVYLKDENVATVIYRAKVKVLEKNNKC